MYVWMNFDWLVLINYYWWNMSVQINLPNQDHNNKMENGLKKVLHLSRHSARCTVTSFSSQVKVSERKTLNTALI